MTYDSSVKVSILRLSDNSLREILVIICLVLRDVWLERVYIKGLALTPGNMNESEVFLYGLNCSNPDYTLLPVPGLV